MTRPKREPMRGDATRTALLHAAAAAFGRDGFHAASTRAIAEAAGANQALIGYHFGGKRGLYLAVFADIAAQMQARLGTALAAVEALLVAPAPKIAAQRREQGLALLQRLTDGVTRVLTRPESTAWAQLILREQQAPTEAFDLLYDGFMGRMLGALTRLVRYIRGGREAQARLIVVTLMGQLLVVRAARAGVLRHLGWSDFGETELKALRRQLQRNFEAQLMPAPRNGEPR